MQSEQRDNEKRDAKGDTVEVKKDDLVEYLRTLEGLKRRILSALKQA